MAKTKTPFFSLESQGSVGESITTQRRGGDTVIRRLPIPTDPYSLPQAYQRWLYEDYVYLWNKPGYLDRDKYRSLGVPHHLTGFQYWMKYALTNLPDILGWWKLDDYTGATFIDSSRNSHSGTVIGATPSAGLIGRAFSLDGINDRLDLGTPPLLSRIGSQPWTFEHLITWHAQPAKTLIFYAGKNAGRGGLILRFGSNNRFGIRSIADNYQLAPVNSTDALIDTPSLVTWTTDGSSFFDVHINGILIHHFGAIDTTFVLQYIGRGYSSNIYNADAIFDNCFFYNRVLDTTEMLRHSLRRYPL